MADAPEARTPEGVTTKHPPRRPVKASGQFFASQNFPTLLRSVSLVSISLPRQGRRLSSKNESGRLSVKEDVPKPVPSERRLSANEGHPDARDEGRSVASDVFVKPGMILLSAVQAQASDAKMP